MSGSEPIGLKLHRGLGVITQFSSFRRDHFRWQFKKNIVGYRPIILFFLFTCFVYFYICLFLVLHVLSYTLNN